MRLPNDRRMLPQAKFEPNDHREGAPHFTYLYSDMTLKFSKCLINIQIWQINFIAQRFQNLFCFFCSASEKFAEDLSTDSLSQGCKMDCEKIAISQQTQFTGRNRNLMQFNFLEGRNCEKLRNRWKNYFRI